MKENIFDNSKVAFKDKSFLDLVRAYFIFKIISLTYIVNLFKKVSKINLLSPLINFITRYTIFKQFCGGEDEIKCNKTVDLLMRSNIYSILDYSVEGLNSENHFNKTLNQTLSLIKLNTNNNFPFIVFKPTGIGDFSIYEKISSNICLNDNEFIRWEKIKSRFDLICKSAFNNNTSVLIDAEESWIQLAIDNIYEELIKKYNRNNTTVYNTVQAYRTDRLDYLKKLHINFKNSQFRIGIKLVRGAYMEKERKRAQLLNYISPIHPNKSDTDDFFNKSLLFMLKNTNLFSVFIGSHNEYSNNLAIEFMNNNHLNKDSVWFSQLYGMSNHISYNLSNLGLNVAKYLPFGPTKEVIPYLLRRADENTSVEGQSGREISLIKKEIKRRLFS